MSTDTAAELAAVKADLARGLHILDEALERAERADRLVVSLRNKLSRAERDLATAQGQIENRHVWILNDWLYVSGEVVDSIGAADLTTFAMSLGLVGMFVNRCQPGTEFKIIWSEYPEQEE